MPLWKEAELKEYICKNCLGSLRDEDRITTERKIRLLTLNEALNVLGYFSAISRRGTVSARTLATAGRALVRALRRCEVQD